MRTAIVFMLLMLVAPVAWSADDTGGKDVVTVRTYAYAAVPDEEWTGAKLEAARIFGRARIAVDWIDCWVPGSDTGAPCTEPLLPGRDLMLRVMERPLVSEARSVALVNRGAVLSDQVHDGQAVLYARFLGVEESGFRDEHDQEQE